MYVVHAQRTDNEILAALDQRLEKHLARRSPPNSRSLHGDVKWDGNDWWLNFDDEIIKVLDHGISSGLARQLKKVTGCWPIAPPRLVAPRINKWDNDAYVLHYLNSTLLKHLSKASKKEQVEENRTIEVINTRLTLHLLAREKYKTKRLLYKQKARQTLHRSYTKKLLAKSIGVRESQVPVELAELVGASIAVRRLLTPTFIKDTRQ